MAFTGDAAPLRGKEPVEVVRASGYNAFLGRSSGFLCHLA